MAKRCLATGNHYMASMNYLVSLPCGGERVKDCMISGDTFCYHILKGCLGICKSIWEKTSGMHVWTRASGWDVRENTALMDEQKLGTMILGDSDRMEDHWS